MSKQNGRRKFTKTLTFKVLCGLVVLFLLGLCYNIIVAEDDVPMSEEEQEEEQQRKADMDTIDIVGDYLWPRMKPSRQDMMTDEEKAKEKEDAKDKQDKTDHEAKSSAASGGEAPMAAPAPPRYSCSSPRSDSKAISSDDREDECTEGGKDRIVCHVIPIVSVVYK